MHSITIKVCNFMNTTFTAIFSTVPDFLREVEQRSWGFVDDRVVKISCYPLEILHSENFGSITRWVLITGMIESMWSWWAISVFVSILGTLLEAEHLHLPWGCPLPWDKYLKNTMEVSNMWGNQGHQLIFQAWELQETSIMQIWQTNLRRKIV